MLPICFGCFHLILGTDPIACAAFPDGIPDAILMGEFDHHKAYPGDRGLRFTITKPK
jgi:hypothetical protein